jgi:uncharacterized protein YceK
MSRVGCLLLLGLGCTGCGTVLNFREPTDPKPNCDALVWPKSIYGGTRLDLAAAANGVTHKLDTADLPWHQEVEAITCSCLCLADVPLSLIGDTMTLPATIGDTVDRACDLKKQAAPPDDIPPSKEPSMTPPPVSARR